MENRPEDLVTTVVITRNGGAQLGRTIALHRGAVILLDNGSTDGCIDGITERFAQIRVVRLPANIGALARNVGVLLANTPYVAFADDDSWWAPDALARAASILQQHEAVAVVAGRILVGPENRPDPIGAEMLHSSLPAWPTVGGRSVVGFVACGAVLRKDAFLQVGGFDDVVFFGGEEERVALDLLASGWDLVYAPHVVAHHHPQPSRDRSERNRLIARNSILTALMRRPWPVTLARVAAALRTSHGRAGVATALPRAARGLLRRRPVPIEVERRLAALERSSR
ncbi:glycosyltransferase family 2 protein [Jiangella asiatica]|uniref:Glycosyltransferase n=1 Tax=Jiangella asiatica TaxID=2530372 RepID=A0A4R5DCJ2_9ACTN|nr:glycosyltransferase [Jiangella asiatica]TDE09720.1 glycosyltransferase [Jiangella asiatica]